MPANCLFFFFLRRWAHTLFLFTKSDFKTILLPIVLFAHLNPASSISQAPHTILWTWVHLLQFCISNQSCNPLEDVRNKPWRPIARGRLTNARARRLRWVMVPICLALSCWYGRHIVFVSIVFAFGVFLHNELYWD